MCTSSTLTLELQLDNQKAATRSKKTTHAQHNQPNWIILSWHRVTGENWKRQDWNLKFNQPWLITPSFICIPVILQTIIWQLIVLFKKNAYYNITILSTPWSIDVGLVVDETLVLDELSTAFPERWVWILTDLEDFLILFARFLLDGPEE